MIKYFSTCTVVGKIRGKGRPRFTKGGHVYTDSATRDYEQLIARSYQEQGGEYYDDGAIRLCVRVIVAVPKSASQAERARMLSGEVKPQKKPDIDNVAKIVMDALNGVAYKDDKQVTDLCSCREYSEEEKIIIDVRKL